MLFKNNQNKLPELMKTIYSIDKERNGYVTQTELDDILKHIFSSNQSKSINTKEISPSKTRDNQIEDMA